METATFDAEYLARLIGGDRDVQDHFARYFGELLRLKLRARVRSAQLIEDISQETLLRVLRNLRSRGLDHPDRLGAYVNSVCNNVIFESFRSESRFCEMNDQTHETPDPHAGADEQFQARELRDQVTAILAELSSKDSQLLKAVFLEDQDKDTVCRQFGVERGYLRVLLHRARLRFRAASEGKLKAAR